LIPSLIFFELFTELQREIYRILLFQAKTHPYIASFRSFDLSQVTDPLPLAPE